jgi:hypothetical protein
MIDWLRRGVLVALAGLAGCATVPAGPSMNALPGSRKSFDQFVADDAVCRQFAQQQIGAASPSAAANQTTAAGAAIGTGLGAAAGALIGGTGSAAGVGAGIGLLAGSAVGASYGSGTYATLQSRYDGAYFQCMYAKGQKIPVAGTVARSMPQRAAPAPPPAHAPFYPPPPDAPPPAPR